MIGAKPVTTTLFHSHPNPKWRTTSKTEPLFIAIPGWRCADPKCPTVAFEKTRRNR